MGCGRIKLPAGGTRGDCFNHRHSEPVFMHEDTVDPYRRRLPNAGLNREQLEHMVEASPLAGPRQVRAVTHYDFGMQHGGEFEQSRFRLMGGACDATRYRSE